MFSQITLRKVLRWAVRLNLFSCTCCHICSQETSGPIFSVDGLLVLSSAVSFTFPSYNHPRVQTLDGQNCQICPVHRTSFHSVAQNHLILPRASRCQNKVQSGFPMRPRTSNYVNILWRTPARVAVVGMRPHAWFFSFSFTCSTFENDTRSFNSHAFMVSRQLQVKRFRALSDRPYMGQNQSSSCSLTT